MHFQRWTDTMTLLIVSPLHNFTLTDISPPNQQAGRRGTLKTFLNSPHLWRSRRELKVPPTAKRLNHGQSNIETIKHANLPWHIKFFFGLFDQMSEESQVSKFTLSVQILKCHWQRQPGAGTELPGQLKMQTITANMMMSGLSCLWLMVLPGTSVVSSHLECLCCATYGLELFELVRIG